MDSQADISVNSVLTRQQVMGNQTIQRLECEEELQRQPEEEELLQAKKFPVKQQK